MKKVTYSEFIPSKQDELYFEQKMNHYLDLLPLNSILNCYFEKNGSVFLGKMSLESFDSDYNFMFLEKTSDLRGLMNQLIDRLHVQIGNWVEKRKEG